MEFFIFEMKHACMQFIHALETQNKNTRYVQSIHKNHYCFVHLKATRKRKNNSKINNKKPIYQSIRKMKPPPSSCWISGVNDVYGQWMSEEQTKRIIHIITISYYMDIFSVVGGMLLHILCPSCEHEQNTCFPLITNNQKKLSNFFLYQKDGQQQHIWSIKMEKIFPGYEKTSPSFLTISIIFDDHWVLLVNFTTTKNWNFSIEKFIIIRFFHGNRFFIKFFKNRFRMEKEKMNCEIIEWKYGWKKITCMIYEWNKLVFSIQKVKLEILINSSFLLSFLPPIY